MRAAALAGVLLALAAGLAAPAPASAADRCYVPVDRRERLILHPRWAKASPIRYKDRPGAKRGDCALVVCRVARDGRLTTCRVLVESPRGSGMGQLVLRAAQNQRLLPRDGDGRLVRGRSVRFGAYLGGRP
jgi:hypothetical protein